MEKMEVQKLSLPLSSCSVIMQSLCIVSSHNLFFHILDRNILLHTSMLHPTKAGMLRSLELTLDNKAIINKEQGKKTFLLISICCYFHFKFQFDLFADSTTMCIRKLKILLQFETSHWGPKQLSLFFFWGCFLYN